MERRQVERRQVERRQVERRQRVAQRQPEARRAPVARHPRVVRVHLVAVQLRGAPWLRVGRQVPAATNPRAARWQLAGFTPRTAHSLQVGFTPQAAPGGRAAAVVPPAQGVRLLQAVHRGSPQQVFVGLDASIRAIPVSQHSRIPRQASLRHSRVRGSRSNSPIVATFTTQLLSMAQR